MVNVRPACPDCGTELTLGIGVMPHCEKCKRHVSEQSIVYQPVPPKSDGLTFQKELTSLLNRYSAENESNTPDYILANLMIECVDAFNRAIREREHWHGRFYPPF